MSVKRLLMSEVSSGTLVSKKSWVLFEQLSPRVRLP